MPLSFVSPAGSVVAAGAGLIAVTYGLVRFGYGLYLPQLSTEFALSAHTAGVIAAGSFLAYCAAAAVAQQLIGRSRARMALWSAGCVTAVGSALVAASWTPAALAAGVLVSGSGAGAASPALVTAVAATVQGRHTERAQAIVNAGTGIGVVVGSLIVVIAPQGWRPAWAAAALAALGATAWADYATRWPPGAAAHAVTVPVPTPAVGTQLACPPRPAPLTPQPRLSPPRQAYVARDLLRPALAAGAAGAGSAAVWTFGRDVLTTTGGLPPRTTALLWCVLGGASVLGALSGDAVRLLGLRGAWVLTVLLTAAGTALLAVAPSSVAAAALAMAVFGGSYTALSGVLIGWASAVRPRTSGQATASLFIALTAGQAVGAAVLGAITEATSTTTAFLVATAVTATAVFAAPTTTHPDEP